MTKSGLKDILVKVRFRIRNLFFRAPKSISKAYYRFVGNEFSAEQTAVASGIHLYNRKLGTSADLYHLRRNVHMIEKGLVMRPRRETFALGYIAETIGLFETIQTNMPSVDSAEMTWFRNVLSEYFVATASAENEIIRKAEAQFSNLRNFDWASGDKCVPAPVGAIAGPSFVSYTDLHALSVSRRSVRWFSPKPVSRETVQSAVQIAQEAPTACNRQPFRFIAADDPESVSLLASVPMGTAGFGHQIPGLVVVVGDLSAFFDERDRHLIYIDASLASMALIYGFETQGVSSCVINWPDIPEREKRIRELLHLGEHERVIMFIAYGYADPAGLAPHSAKKSPLEALSFERVRR